MMHMMLVRGLLIRRRFTMLRATQTFRFAALLVAFSFLGCSTAPKTEGGKLDLKDDTESALNRFTRDDAGLNDFLGKSVGYAMFPDVGKGGAVVGGAYGRGEVFENGQ